MQTNKKTKAVSVIYVIEVLWHQICDTNM